MSSEHNEFDQDKGTLPMRPRINAVPRPTGDLSQPFSVNIPEKLRLFLLDAGHAIEVPVKPYFVIGRKSSLQDYEVNIDLGDYDGRAQGVSRFHAMFLALGERLTIKDLDSKNGTYINGQVLEPGHEYLVQDGDELSVGNLKMRVEFV